MRCSTVYKIILTCANKKCKKTFEHFSRHIRKSGAVRLCYDCTINHTRELKKTYRLRRKEKQEQAQLPKKALKRNVSGIFKSQANLKGVSNVG